MHSSTRTHTLLTIIIQNTHAIILRHHFRAVLYPVYPGCVSFHCMISPRSAMFGTSFLFGSLALEIGSVCLVRSQVEQNGGFVIFDFRDAWK